MKICGLRSMYAPFHVEKNLARLLLDRESGQEQFSSSTIIPEIKLSHGSAGTLVKRGETSVAESFIG